MEAKDLMIGNIVDTEDGVIQIVSFEHDKLHSSKGVYHYRQDVKPIPLTEEWFDLNLNCLDSDWIFEGFGGRIIIRHKKLKGIVLESCANNQVAFFLNGNLISFLDYVHSLQNLYKALTGEELVHG